MNTEIFDLGKIGITLGYEYDSKAIYEKLTIVLYKGKSYISTKTTQGVSPEQDNKTWQLVAEAKDAYHMLVDAGKTTLTEEKFLEQLVDATKGRYIVQGNIINAADEEDLTVEHSELLGIDTLKLADRPSTDGMGYVILRKNKSFAEQVTKENTIYEIKYEFELEDSEVNIPEGCVLDFRGGSLKNGTIKGNKTKLNVLSKSNVIFKQGLLINGTWNVPSINIEWYDLLNVHNQLEGVQQMLKLQNDNQFNHIIFPSYELTLTPSYASEKMMIISSNTKVSVPCAIYIGTNNFKGASLFVINNKKNIEIEGTKLVGDMDTHIIPEESGTHEWQFGISINGSENITISNFICTKFMGDGIYLGNYGLNKNITLKNITSDLNRRQGLSVERIDGLTIERCAFTNTGRQLYTAPSAGIDFEPWIIDDQENPITIKNILIKECYFSNNTSLDIKVDNINGLIENLIVDNCFFDNTLFNDGVVYSGLKSSCGFNGCVKDILFKNCKFTNYSIWHNLPENSGYRTTNIILDSCEINNCIWYYDSEKTEKIIIKNSNIQPFLKPWNNANMEYPLLSISGKSANADFINCTFRNKDNLCSHIINTKISDSFYPDSLRFFGCTFDGEGFENKYLELSVASDVIGCTFKDFFIRVAIIREQNIRIEKCVFEQITDSNIFFVYGLYKEANTPIRTDNYYKIYINNNTFIGNNQYINIYHTSGREDIDLSFQNNEYTGNLIEKNNKKYGIFKTSKRVSLDINKIKGSTEERPTDYLYIGQQYYDTTLDRNIFWNGNYWVDDRGNNAYKAKGPTEERPFGANYDLYIGMLYFDTTLNKPIWWNGNKWIDATGADV